MAVHRFLAYAAGRLALGIGAVGQVGDRLLERLRDGREVPLVAGGQRRVGPHFATLISVDLSLGRRLCGTTRVLPQKSARRQ